MSAESKKINYNERLPLLYCLGGQTPKGKIIKFNFNSLKLKRKSLAIKQIKIYKKKIKLFPHKKSLYIEEINKIIMYERKGVRNEEK